MKDDGERRKAEGDKEEGKGARYSDTPWRDCSLRGRGHVNTLECCFVLACRPCIRQQSGGDWSKGPKGRKGPKGLFDLKTGDPEPLDSIL